VSSKKDNHPREAAALAVFCRSCSSPLVQASGWVMEDEAHWRVRRWCPECWHDQTLRLDRAQSAYLSLAVEEGFACLLEAFEGLEAIPTIEPDHWLGRDRNQDPMEPWI
jgi:ribosomal protein S27E